MGLDELSRKREELKLSPRPEPWSTLTFESSGEEGARNWGSMLSEKPRREVYEEDGMVS